MAKKKKVGDIYRFNFDEKYHCYCQILEANDVCFFDFYSDCENDDIDKVLDSKELFRIFCDRDCFKGNKWKYICNKELTKDKKIIQYKYHQAIGDDYYSLYKEGVFTKTSRENCFGLEFFTLWTEFGLIQRLNYSFFNHELLPHVLKHLPFYK